MGSPRSALASIAAFIVVAAGCNAIVGNEDGTYRPRGQGDGGASSSSGTASGGVVDGNVIELDVDAGPPVVTLMRSPRLFTTRQWLYFTDDDGSSNTRIRRMPAQGGESQLVLNYGRAVADIASDDVDLLFSTAACPGDVLACTLNPTTGECGPVRVIASMQANPRRVALDETQFVWVNANIGCGTQHATAMRAQRPAGTPTEVRQPFTPFAPAAVARAGGATAVGVRKPDDPATGYVMLCTDAKACTVVASGPGTSEITAAGDALFWVGDGTPPDFSNGSIFRGTAQVSSGKTWVENQRHPEALAVDGTHVYWTTNDATNPSAPGTIARCSRTEPCIVSPPQILVRPLGPRAIVVDDTFVTYAATAPPGFAIFRFKK